MATWLFAREEKRSGDKHFDPVQTIGAKLGLDDKQKEEIRKIHNDFNQKTDALMQQLWTLRHEECEEMKKALTDEQRAKLPDVLKAEKDKEFQKIVSRLELNEEQKAKVQKIRDSFAPKFEELAQQKGDNVGKQFRKLKHEAFGAVCEVLNPDQRNKFPGVIREEFRLWRDTEARREHLRAMADQLGLKEQQKEQEQKILDDYNRKIQQPANELKELHRQEAAAMEKVLTAEQRTKWQELKKQWGFKEDQSEPRKER